MTIEIAQGAADAGVEPEEAPEDWEEEAVLGGETGFASADVATAGCYVGSAPGLRKMVELNGPLAVVGQIGFDVAFDGVGDVRDEGEDAFPDEFFPGRGEPVFASVEVVFTGGTGDFFLAGCGDGTFREAGVGAVGGEFAGGDFEQWHRVWFLPRIV